MSFGKWYEEQKEQQNEGTEEESGLSLGKISGLFAGNSSSENTDGEGENNEGNMMLPLFGGGPNGGLSGIKQSLEAQLPSKVCGMNYAERFRMFSALLFISSLCFFLGFTVGLSTIYIRPQKFALSFTLGSLTFMSSFAILKGPFTHFMGMLETDRLPFTIVYLGSMFATLYFTMTVGGVSGYVTVIACSGLQILALLWYLVTFIPGGSAGMSVLMSGLAKMIGPIISGCTTVWAAIISRLFGWMTR